MTGLAVVAVASGAVLRQESGRLTVRTPGQGFTDITAAIARFSAGTGLLHGVATVFCQHTSASLTIQENTDPDVLRDLLVALDRLAPRDDPYRHRDEGPDDMPAHIRATLGDVSLSIPILDGRLALGTWQAVYLVEHRDQPHRREIVVTVTGA